MAEYIEKEKAVAILVHDYAYAAATMIKEIPPADVVEVVRFKDCKWGEIFTDTNENTRIACRKYNLPQRDLNDFCSYGEKEERPCLATSWAQANFT